MKVEVLLMAAALALSAGSAASVNLPRTLALGLQEVVLDSATILSQARAGQVTLLLPNGPVSLSLVPRPIAQGATWGLNGVPLGAVTETVTFQGEANGAPARLAATEAGVFAAVFDPDPLFVVPGWVVQPGLPTNVHLAWRWSDVPARISPHAEPVSPYGFSGASLTAAPANRVVDLLIEEDFALYEKSSALGACNACWIQVQQAIMNVVEQLFEPQTGVSFRITSQWACTSVVVCPYQGTNSGDWQEAFRDRWEAIQNEPDHHLGHLLSGTNWLNADGSAWTGVVNTPNGYAVSEFAANLSPFAGSLFLNFVTTAHEIGHNFNAVHAEADRIPPALAGTGQTDRVYTIMWPGGTLHYQFSDGTWIAAHNNAGRIVSHALQQLPP